MRGCCCEECIQAPRLLRPAKTAGSYGRVSAYFDKDQLDKLREVSRGCHPVGTSKAEHCAATTCELQHLDKQLRQFGTTQKVPSLPRVFPPCDGESRQSTSCMCNMTSAARSQ